MWRALALARRGRNLVSPNPCVGAVVVKDGVIVGEGFHKEYGGPHAEIVALEQAGKRADGATMYVTLEPCNHQGKTPPCADAIIAAKIARVLVASRDPNPSVAGGGVEKLRQAKVVVGVGLLESIALEVNRAWRHWVQTALPFVTVKLAVSEDEKISFPGNEKRWLSSAVARTQVQRMRSAVDAIMVGKGTVLADNPQLTNRTGKGKQPQKVIIDRDRITTVALKDGEIDLRELLSHLGMQGVTSVLCEGGARLATRLIESGLCQRLMIYETPHVVGAGGTPFPYRQLLNQFPAQLVDRRPVGPDVLAVYDFM